MMGVPVVWCGGCEASYIRVVQANVAVEVWKIGDTDFIVGYSQPTWFKKGRSI